MILLLLALACRTSDPALVAERQVLDRWTAGEAALRSGDPVAASAAFEDARALRPDDPLLGAWAAQALADRGDLPGAIDAMAKVLEQKPDFAIARYNRAAWLARAGRLDEAGPELQAALQDGAARPREALNDADFTPYLQHPAFAFLPRSPLVVSSLPLPTSVFWGSEVPLQLRVGGASGPITIAGPVSGPIAIGDAIEEIRQSTDGPAHELTWPVRVLGPGEAVLGGFTVTSGPGTGALPAQRFTCTAPPGKEAPPDVPAAELLVPSALGGAWADASAHRVGARVWVRAQAADRVEIDPKPAGLPRRLELREGGRTTFVLYGWEVEGAPRVRVIRNGSAIFDGLPE